MGLNLNLSPLGLNTDPFSALEKMQKHCRCNFFFYETGGNLDESFKSEEDDNDKDTEDEKKDDDFENDDIDIEVL